MTFLRLTRGHAVAAVAALALLVVMSVTWYGTRAGDDARAAKTTKNVNGSLSGEIPRAVNADADRIYALSTDTAWQANAKVDRLILFALLAAAVMATAAAWLRAAGAKFDPPLTPSAVTTWVALVASMLLAFRIAQLPSTDAGAVVKLGAPLGLVCVGLIALGARFAWKAEVEEAHPLAAEPEPAAEPALVGAGARGTQSLWNDEWDHDTDETWAIGWDHDTDENDALPKMEVLPDKPRRHRRGLRRR
jgi:hypothetical protein